MIWLKYIGIFLLFMVAAIAGMILMAPSELSFQVNEDINAPISKVYTAHSDLSQFPNWIIGVESTKQVHGHGAAVGSQYEVHFKDNMVLNHKVTLMERNMRYAYNGEVIDFMRVNSNTTFEELDTNSTRVMTKLTMKPLSSTMKMFMYLESTHKSNAAANLAKLKQYLEQ